MKLAEANINPSRMFKFLQISWQDPAAKHDDVKISPLDVATREICHSSTWRYLSCKVDCLGKVLHPINTPCSTSYVFQMNEGMMPHPLQASPWQTKNTGDAELWWLSGGANWWFKHRENNGKTVIDKGKTVRPTVTDGITSYKAGWKLTREPDGNAFFLQSAVLNHWHAFGSGEKHKPSNRSMCKSVF